MNTNLDKAILVHIASRGGEFATVAKQLGQALGLGADATNASPGTPTLAQIYEAGCKSLGVTGSSTSTGAPESSSGGVSAADAWQSKFDKFVQVLTTRNFFAGCEKGSPEYATRLNNAREKFEKKHGKQPVVEDEAAALEHKEEGNRHLLAGEHEKAIAAYTEAIRLYSKNAVFYANRAAALTHLKRYEEALTDAERAVEVDPTYAKGHSRKGTALMCLGRESEAADAYRAALELHPDNQGFQEALVEAETKAKAKAGDAPSEAAVPEGMPQGMPQGMPDLSALGNMFGGGAGGGGGAAGAGGIDQLFSNPDVMAQVQQMMSNPQMQQMAQQLMSDPSAMSGLLSSMGMQQPPQ